MNERVITAQTKTGIGGVLDDLREGFAQGQLWRSFAWEEIQNRYRRSALGIAWVGLSYAFFVVVIVIIFRGMARGGTSEYFLIHVAMGFAAFSFITSNLSDGAEVFRSAGTWIKSTTLPYSIYIYKSISRSVFTFFVQLLVGFGVMAIMGWRPNLTSLLALPAVGVFLLNAIAIQIVVGLGATRYRDLSHLISTVMRMLFFMTPVIWTLEQRSGFVRQIALINPITHYVEIFRAPIAKTEMMPESWPIVIILTIIVWVMALLSGSRLYRRLPFWI